ncbi:LOS2 protein, partial [Tanacetum coccineum]
EGQEPDVAVAKKRLFKKFSFHGVDLDALLDMSTDELVKMFTARARRRGLKRKPMALIKKLRKAVVIGMDVAASEFYGKDKNYDLNFKEEVTSHNIFGLKRSIFSTGQNGSEYPIVSIEDPFDQDDWEHYGKMTAECADKVQIVGDNLLVTNPTKAIEEKSCNALLLKINQIGSVTESIEAVKMSKHVG